MLTQKLILSFSTRIIVQFVQIAASIIVARVAGPGVLGTVAFGLAYVSLFSFIADLGFGTAHIKNVSEGEDLSKCIGTFIRIKLFLIVSYIISVIAFIGIQKFVFHQNFESNDHIIVIFVMLFAVSIEQLFAIPKTTFTADTLQAKTDIPDIIKVLVYQVMRIATVFLGYHAIALAVGKLMSVILIAPVFFFLFKDYERGKYDKDLGKKYLKIALPVMVIGMTSKFTETIDKVLLQFFSDSEQLGYYVAGYRIGGFVLLIGQSIGNLFFPIFSRAFTRQDFIFIKKSIDKYERFTFLYVMPVVIILTINSDIIILAILGKEYTASVSIMMMINIAMFLMVINIPYGNVLTGTGHFKTSARLNLLTFLVYSASLIVMLHPGLLNLAGFGATISLCFFYFVRGILVRISARKIIPILSNAVAMKFTLYGLLNLLISLSLCKYQPNLDQISNRLFFSIFYFIITYASLFLLGLMKKNDLKYVTALIDVKSLVFYVKSEILRKDIN